MQQGLYEADLGGGLLKKRIARSGQGKRDGFHTIVATNHGDRSFFLYGFAKNERADIDDNEAAALKKAGGSLLKMPPASLAEAGSTHGVTRVKCDGEKTFKDS